jgi:hypothetical protein
VEPVLGQDVRAPVSAMDAFDHLERHVVLRSPFDTDAPNGTIRLVPAFA